MTEVARICRTYGETYKRGGGTLLVGALGPGPLGLPLNPALPQIVLPTLIGNFANKVACFSRIM